MVMTKGVWLALANGFVSDTGNASVDDLLTRGGMSSMLVTIWLVIAAMAFGAVLEHSGMLMRLIESALKAAKSTGSLILTVAPELHRHKHRCRRPVHLDRAPRKNVQSGISETRSRCKESVTSHRRLGNAYIAARSVEYLRCLYGCYTLGVATLAYLPFVFFNLINPFVSVIYGYTGFTIRKIEELPEQAVLGIDLSL